MTSYSAQSLLDIKATIMLADYATVANSKLTVVGGGWNIVSGATPFTIAALFDVPAHLAGQEHSFSFQLLDADGQYVVNAGDEPINISGQIKVEDPPAELDSIIVPLAINAGYLNLDAGRTYVWRLHINDKTHDDWRLSFTVV